MSTVLIMEISRLSVNTVCMHCIVCRGSDLFYTEEGMAAHSKIYLYISWEKADQV